MKNTQNHNTMNGNKNLMTRVLNDYQTRYPKLFLLNQKEAKDDVRFVFIAK